MLPATPPPLPSPAPIADPKRASPVVGIALGALAGVLVGTLIAKLGIASFPRLSLTAWQKAALVVSVVATMPLVTLVHELGHVAGGLLAGLEFNMLIWGPIRLMREGREWHLVRNRSLSLAGGMALCVPTDARSGNGAAAVMVAGGPVVSLLLGGALLLLARAIGAPAEGAIGFGRALALVLASGAGLASLGVGLVTLVPMRTSGFLTDGARLLRLARGGGTAARDRAMMTLAGLASSPTRPREWPPSLVRELDAAQDGSPFDTAGPLLAYFHDLDRGDGDAAHAALRRVVERLGTVPPTARGSYATEFAFYELALRGDAARGRAWLEWLPESPLDDRLVRPLVVALARGLDREPALRAEALRRLPALAARSGIDRMRSELVRAVLER